jgi:hypothetical protein
VFGLRLCAKLPHDPLHSFSIHGLTTANVSRSKDEIEAEEVYLPRSIG